MSNEIVKGNKVEIDGAVETFSNDFSAYLEHLGLPTKKVLVDANQRRTLLTTLPIALSELRDEARRGAFYVSKFIAASGAGLFDAALTYLWDEVVANLRGKVAQFDLEYFFDSAITDPQQRSKYSTENDLRDVEDWALINGCQRCGFLTEIAYKHLNYIRDMRNWASAAHPNQYELTGLQLTAWMETCIREVLSRPIEGPVLEVRRLLENLRTQTLTLADRGAVSKSLSMLPDDLATALLRSCFGLYCDPKLDARVRNNITMIADAVWKRAPEPARHEAGLKYANYSANADIARKTNAKGFLDAVGGLAYLPDSDLALEMQHHLDRLVAAHRALNNFYNEGAPAHELSRHVPASGEVPGAVIDLYVKTVTYCKVGRPSGVARWAEPHYDEMIAKFGERQVVAFARLPLDGEVSARVQYAQCAQRFRTLAAALLPRIVNVPLQHVLTMIIGASDPQMTSLGKDTRYLKALEKL